MNKKNYLSLIELSKALNKNVSKLENGKLALSELNVTLEHSRDIYERLTILRYKALLEQQEKVEEISEESNPTQDKMNEEVEESNFSFKFEVDNEESIDISPNQRNLLDEIQEVGGEEEKTSVNDQYASTSDKTETLAEKLTKTKIKDLRQGIALNQKFLFMNDLFGGEKEAYDAALDKLNSFDSIIEAKAFLTSEVENKYDWKEDSSSVQQFVTLLERKFL